jgi:hypothetical protein
LRPLTDGDIEKAEAIVKRRDAVLPTEVVGKTGESYVRWLLGSAGHFKMPRRGTRFPIGDRFADLRLSLLRPEVPLSDIVVEVKNTYETFTPTSDELRQVVEYAIGMKTNPVLVASHLSPKAERVCETLGIATLHLRRQLFPTSHPGCKRVATEVKRLEPLIIGPAPYECISPERPYQKGKRAPSEAALRDLAIVCDPDWLYRPVGAWEGLVADVESELLRGQPWPAVRRELERRIRKVQEENAQYAIDHPEVKLLLNRVRSLVPGRARGVHARREPAERNAHD